MSKMDKANFLLFLVTRFWAGLLWIFVAIAVTWFIHNWFPIRLLFWIDSGWIYMRWVIGAGYLAWVLGVSSFVIADQKKVSIRNIALATLGFIIAVVSLQIFGGAISWIWVTVCAALQIIPFALENGSWANRSQLLVHITNFTLITVGWLIIAGTGW